MVVCDRGFEENVDTCADVSKRLSMYKLKDWPTEDDFQNKLPRHFADFVRMIPFQVSGTLAMQ